jgi:hypothetical protein
VNSTGEKKKEITHFLHIPLLFSKMVKIFFLLQQIGIPFIMTVINRMSLMMILIQSLPIILLLKVNLMMMNE